VDALAGVIRSRMEREAADDGRGCDAMTAALPLLEIPDRMTSG
jgi:hypothetical protein